MVWSLSFNLNVWWMQGIQQSTCPILPAVGSLANEVAKARQHIKQSLQCVSTALSLLTLYVIFIQLTNLMFDFIKIHFFIIFYRFLNILEQNKYKKDFYIKFYYIEYT